MKTIYQHKITFLAGLIALLLVSCELDEYNPNTSSIDLAYETVEGFEGLLDYCYTGLYYFYGKIDGIGIMEMGTDLWFSEDKETGFSQYGSEMTTELGTLKVFWQGMYSTINYCNLAIYYADQVAYPDTAQRNRKVAEAYFLRAWSNLNLVEQFGNVVLSEVPSFEAGSELLAPTRSTETEFYNLIISDLKFACKHLPVTNLNEAGEGERGRATQKAAYGMLAKAYLQRTRLNEPEASDYARLALEAAKELIDNPDKYNCSLYTSEDSVSGYSKLWKGTNNKENKEFLFIEAVDHVTGYNPDGWNRGRTRQYYLMDLRTVGAEWGTTEGGCSWYGRANDRGFKPSKYLLTEVFEPVSDPTDTRFSETFFSEYYNSSGSGSRIGSLVYKYDKVESLGFHEIKNTLGATTTENNYYGGINASGMINMTDEDNDGFLDGLSVYTPNYTYTAEEKRVMPFLCVDPSDMFDAEGKWVTSLTSENSANFKECYPSMRKLSSLYWISSNQHWMGDVPILRLGEVYLIAAEAALRYNNDQATAATYVNAIRQRAAIAQRADEMTVANGDVTLDFILEERARELAGEQVRWVDLKRYGKLTSAYLTAKNPDIISFDDELNIVRPIPQSFLDAITNPGEFGTNGY